MTRSVAGLVELLREAALPPARPDLATLPEPVARYFTFALPAHGPLPRFATLGQEGQFRRSAWSAFKATEYFASNPPGFVWDAAIRMLPLLDVRVRDSYVAGEGRMHAAMGRVFTIVNQGGTPAMASASLLRFVAEGAWLPTALLPRDGLTWHAAGPDRAAVALRDGTVEVTLDVTFAPDGGIAEVNAMRDRDVGGTPVPTPWRGRFTDYAERGGLVIPLAGEVAWIIDGKEEPYWRGKIVSAEFS